MAEEMQDSEPITKGTEEEAQEIESQIKAAMSSRVGHFKEQADSLTFEGVRRLLEKDLGLETYALDVHKRFVKQFLLECINAAADDNPSKKSGETRGKNVCSTKGEAAEPPETVKSKKEVKEPSSGDEEKIEGSPVLGLMTGQKIAKSETEETQGKENKEVPSESTIKKAIRKRASYFKAKSENITMAGVRRVLEEDLKLDKKTLDPYKKFISEQLDEVLKSLQVSKPTTGVKKGSPKKNSHSRASRKTSSEGSSESLESESDEEEVKPKTKMAPKGKAQNSEDLRKRKRPVKETKMPSKKRSKTAETVSEDNGDAEDSGNVSDDGHSQSSSEKPVKRKEVSAPAYGKRVENLKSIIKSCAMSVPPSVYKRVKQAPENKREAHLIKELEEILSKEGLSKNPSEKDIKEVRKKKERAKELEGIDTSNIVLSSRRRSTRSFVAPPKPKIPDESESEDAEDTDDDDDDDDDDEEEEEVEDEEDDGGEDDDASQSEELNEDNAGDSD
ncbi:glutamic acid-rich protein-like [Vitis riparia]|uniref:glutamic acid-rich protein-like n=1 Tax=Vitis riparia TaxID=96939 RepID=UPI00155A1F26|nr:glutamic acid-rich protein-like [Vitis riparia]